jgi:hypothetical protein
MRLISVLKEKLTIDRNQLQALREIAEGVSNQAELINRKFNQLFVTHDNQSTLLNDKFDQLLAAQSNASTLTERKLDRLITKLGTDAQPQPRPQPRNFEEAMRQQPLMIDDRTYNTNHPDYEADVVRNYPGRVFNRKVASANFVFNQLVKGIDDEVPDDMWNKRLAEALIEAASETITARGYRCRRKLNSS